MSISPSDRSNFNEDSAYYDSDLAGQSQASDSPSPARKTYNSRYSSGEERSYDGFNRSPVRKRSRQSNSGKTLTLDRNIDKTLTLDCNSGKPLTVDLISLLPDSVLIHILSFLPMEEIIKTGVLSKRWQLLWTFTPNLIFIDHKKSYGRFASWVDQTLVFWGASKIQRFMIDCRRPSGYNSNVDSWVRFAMKNNAEELTLHLHERNWDSYYRYRENYRMPQHLYTKSRLTKMSLSACKVAPNGVINWNSLTSLTVGYVLLSEDVIEKILLGSPVLEYLRLDHFEGIKRLNITSATVKKLVLRDYRCSQKLDYDYLDGEDERNEAESVLEILGPNLHTLEILGCFRGAKCRIMNVESLVEVNLNFNLGTVDGREDKNYEECRNTLKELLESLHHVENLTIGTWCIQLLMMSEKVGLHLPLSTRKCLKLDTRIKKRDLYGMVNLLASSPDLQSLIINMDPPYKSEISHGISLFDIPTLMRTECLCLQLKTIKIVNFVEGHYVFDLLEFLLKNEVLEKMIISAPGEGNNSSRDLFRVTKKLLNFPRASPRFVGCCSVYMKRVANS